MKRILGALLIVALVGLVTLPADAASAAKVSVHGTVTAKADATPIAGIQVCAQRQGGAEACATSGDDGSYALRLKVGSYTVVAQDASLYGSWVRHELNHGKAIRITKSRTLGVTMVRGARITGYLRPDDGHEVSSCCVGVEAYPVDTHGHLDTNSSLFSNVGSSGYFEVAKLPAGRYKLFVSDNTDAAAYGRQWFPDAPTASRGTTITVRTGQQATGHDMTLHAPGTLTVKVRQKGKAVSGYMDVFDADRRLVTTAQTARGGTARADGLHSGSYRVRYTSQTTGRVEWFNHHSTFKAATPIKVTAGKTSTRTAALLTPRMKAAKRPTLELDRQYRTARTRGGRWTVRPESLTYLWYRDGHRSDPDARRAYHYERSDIGHRLQVCVVASRRGHDPGRSCSPSHRLTAGDVPAR